MQQAMATAYSPAREIEFLSNINLEILAGRNGLDMAAISFSKAHSNSAVKLSSTYMPHFQRAYVSGHPSQEHRVYAARRAAGQTVDKGELSAQSSLTANMHPLNTADRWKKSILSKKLHSDGAAAQA